MRTIIGDLGQLQEGGDPLIFSLIGFRCRLNQQYWGLIMRLMLCLHFVLLTGCGGLEVIAGSYAVGLAGYSVVDTVTPNDISNE